MKINEMLNSEAFGLTRFGIERPRFAGLLTLALLVSGVALFVGFPKSEEPTITIRTALVNAAYPGMSPSRLERLVAEPIERKIREMPEVKEIETLLVTGWVQIRVTLHDRYEELDPIWQSLRNKMQDVSPDLPAETEGPYVNDDFGDVTIATIALTAEGFSYREMETAAKNLQRLLYTISGVAKITLHGVQNERVFLEFDSRSLAIVGSQIEPLIRDLQQQNVILPTGQLNADGTTFLLEATGDFKSIDQVRDLLTSSTQSETLVRVRDLVSVERSYEDPPQTKIEFNSRPAVALAIEMQPGVDILRVGRDIADLASEFEASQPIGFETSLATFQPSNVSVSVGDAIDNVLQTFAVVLLIVMAFLGFRTGLVIASIVPLSVLFALVGMNYLDIVLEQVSIAAVIISLGLLVDNGVVVVEDIQRRLDKGESAQSAALAAGAHYSVPLLVASLTTVFAFLPFFLLDGDEGEYSYSLGVVLALSLAGSWISAMYLLPLLASKTLQRRSRSDDLEARWVTTYRVFLSRVLKQPLLVSSVCYALVAAGIFLFFQLPNQLFPESPRGEVLVHIDLPQGTHFTETERVAKNVASWVGDSEENPEVDSQVLYVGDGGPRFYLSLDPAEQSPSSAFLLVNTGSRSESTAFLQRARAFLYQNFPEARFRLKRLSMGAEESGVVDIEISGPDPDHLLALARQVERIIADVPGVTVNQNDWGRKIVKVLISVDQDNARRLGVSSDSLSRVLSAYFDGYPISDFRTTDKPVPIMFRAVKEDRNSIDDLANIFVLGAEGQVLPLDQIAETKPVLEFSRLRRENQQRQITITSKSELLTSYELLDSIQAQLDALDLGQGYQITIGGEIEESEEVYGALAQSIPLGFILMVMVIMYQFDSFARTSIVFLTVPLVLVGAPIGLLLSGQPVSFMGTLGLLSLAGVIINNGIVLVDQIDKERSSYGVYDALLEACATRARPILLTSVTTVVGLLPLFFFGGPMWTPLAAVIIGGLSIASLLSLVFVPAMYLLVVPERHDSAIKEHGVHA